MTEFKGHKHFSYMAQTWLGNWWVWTSNSYLYFFYRILFGRCQCQGKMISLNTKKIAKLLVLRRLIIYYMKFICDLFQFVTRKCCQVNQLGTAVGRSQLSQSLTHYFKKIFSLSFSGGWQCLCLRSHHQIQEYYQRDTIKLYNDVACSFSR